MYTINVKWILDACTLIYLVKMEMFHRFQELLEEPILIDTSVYQEVVIKGKELHYPDALKAEKILTNYKIPIIPVDVEQHLEKLRDPGETSCYVLAQEENTTCITSDNRAFNKFRSFQLSVIKIDFLFFRFHQQQKISDSEFLDILEKLQQVWATTAKDILYFQERIQEKTQKSTKDVPHE